MRKINPAALLDCSLNSTFWNKKIIYSSESYRKIGASKVTQSSITDKSNSGMVDCGLKLTFLVVLEMKSSDSKQAEVQSSFNPSRNQLKGHEITTMAT